MDHVLVDRRQFVGKKVVQFLDDLIVPFHFTLLYNGFLV
jgi:hypothetical protein